MNPYRQPLLLALTSFFFSCNSDGDQVICRPVTVKFPAYTETYVYDESNRIGSILYDVPDAGIRTGELEYNEKGKLVRLLLFDFNSPPTWYLKCELIYDKKGNLQKSYWVQNPPTGAADTTFFYHDENQRLVKIQGNGDGKRYEYDGNGNVIKIFRIFESEEILYTENISYDNKLKYDGNVPELETLNVYMNGYLPGLNNLVTATIHDDFPGYPKVNPQDVAYTLDYNEDGLITSCLPHNIILYDVSHFEQITYSCE
ncbi:hypothetical protein [Chryseolinea sp. H1M3-3]|uniref:hypothetical protein n=1 Tax=Chryseolinea sp. H1M3-3 TaxID=3034144 RepID=UPI0023ED5A7D|nr:hypothetical protein [Chryseolinea sp. H1M3-3]